MSADGRLQGCYHEPACDRGEECVERYLDALRPTLDLPAVAGIPESSGEPMCEYCGRWGAGHQEDCPVLDGVAAIAVPTSVREKVTALIDACAKFDKTPPPPDNDFCKMWDARAAAERELLEEIARALSRAERVIEAAEGVLELSPADGIGWVPLVEAKNKLAASLHEYRAGHR